MSRMQSLASEIEGARLALPAFRARRESPPVSFAASLSTAQRTTQSSAVRTPAHSSSARMSSLPRIIPPEPASQPGQSSPRVGARLSPRRTDAPAPTGAPSSAAEVSAAQAGQYAGLINAAATRYGLDPTLVAAVAKAESGFNPKAVSHAGAKGLMQLMDGTARALGVTDSFDPRQNVDGGARFLSEMLRQFKTPELALAAYNAGPGAVAKHGGIPPFKETQTYVRRVLGYQREMLGAS